MNTAGEKSWEQGLWGEEVSREQKHLRLYEVVTGGEEESQEDGEVRTEEREGKTCRAERPARQPLPLPLLPHRSEGWPLAALPALRRPALQVAS